MMKCEKCEHELPGGAVICRQCGFNNALQRIGGWRARREFEVSDQAGQEVRRPSRDARLIRFPTPSHKTKAAEEAQSSQAVPPVWRQRLDDTIRGIRERRTVEEAERQAAAESLQPNPLVEAAVGRLRRTESSTSNTPMRTTGHGAQATAHAIKREAEPAPITDAHPLITPPPIARPTAHIHTASSPVKSARASATLSGLIEKRAAGQAISSPALSTTAHTAEETIHSPLDPHSAEVEIHAAESHAPYASEASLLARAIANIIDIGIITLSYLPFLTAFTLFDMEFSRGSLYLLSGIAVTMIFCYHLLTVAVAGRTGGMALCKLRILDAASECVPPTLGQAFGRALGATLSLLLLPLNLLVILLSLERLSLSDYFSGTIIVRQ